MCRVELDRTVYLVSSAMAVLGGVLAMDYGVRFRGLHPSGRNAGHSIVREMQQASLWNDAGMANLVRLVPYKGLSGLNHARQQIRLVNNARQQIRSSKLR